MQWSTRFLRRLGMSVLIMAMAESAAAAPLLYVVREFDPELRVVDAADASTVTTHTITLSGETVLGSSGLAKNPVTGDLHALLWLDGQDGRELVTLDGSTGAVTSRIGDTGDFFTAITFDPSGNLFALTHDDADTPSTLSSISLADATPTFEATLGNGGFGEALAMSADGSRFFHASGYPGDDPIFESVDASTYTTTNLGYSGDVADEVLALALGLGGALYMTDYLGTNGVSDLFTLSTTGVATRIGDLGFSDARGIAIVPEPGTVLLLSVGLIGLGAGRRGGRAR